MNLARSVLRYIVGGLLVMVIATLVFGKSPARDNSARRESRASIAPHSSPPEGRTAKALRGKPVEDRIGEDLGRVNDFVIDSRSGRIVFVLLTSGGFAGMGARLKPVPPAALSQATAKRNVLALALEPGRWQNAPTIDKSRLGAWDNPASMRAIYEYYGQPFLSPTGRDDPKEGAGRLKLASDLVGQTVVNHRNEELGRVSDLTVDLANPTNTRAIFEEDGAGSRFAVPINVFTIHGEGNSLILNQNVPKIPHAQRAVADFEDEAISLRAASMERDGS